MELTTRLRTKPGLTLDLDAAAAYIARTQKANGEIPWSENDKTDPWDHVESAMGLNISGYRHEARRAFRWMAENQLPDGSWYYAYRHGQPQDRTQDTNMSSYIAVGVFHDYLLTGDLVFLEEMWPTVRAALDFALGFQAPGGEIYWARSPEGILDQVALLTGSSSVFMSLKCALSAARRLKLKQPLWLRSLARLGEAIRSKPNHFNMTKARYSMDWFYPILAGAVKGAEAQRRIVKSWEKFVVRGQGVLCVSDQPWITIAETSEFILALAAMGNLTLARIIFSWIRDRVYDDGSYWAGYTFPDLTIWPEEKITWTNAGVLMAADALDDLTPASRLFNHRFWEEEAASWE
ncbi:MAG: phenyltransferase domain-containing protein [Thermodesulfobacteriota bacterium]